MSLSMYFIPRTGNLHIGFYQNHRIPGWEEPNGLSSPTFLGKSTVRQDDPALCPDGS